MKVFSEFWSCGNNIVLTQTVGARFAGPESETVAEVEGESATLVCGTGLSGNPLPTLTWTDNTGRWGAVDKRDAILSSHCLRKSFYAPKTNFYSQKS